MSTTRYEAVAEVINEKFYIVSGAASEGYYSLTLEVYYPSTDIWTETSIPTERISAVAGVIRGNSSLRVEATLVLGA